MPVLVEAVNNDSFPLPMTAGSENPDFFYDLMTILMTNAITILGTIVIYFDFSSLSNYLYEC